MKIVICTIMLLTLQPAIASNFNWKFSVDAINAKSIGDDEREEKVGDWVCTIGKPIEDKFGNEMRRLGCGMPGGLQAYLLSMCNKNPKGGKPFNENSCISLQQKQTGSKLVCLACE